MQNKNHHPRDNKGKEDKFFVTPPAVSLPKGGGAIRGIGEKFAANPVTGTGSMSVPIATSPGRSGFGPQLSLSYDSGAGNGPFGFGWSLSLPSITRKTDKGLPRYRDEVESDVFLLSGAEDLVPVLVRDVSGQWADETVPSQVVGLNTYNIRRYRPRVEGLFARIERWTNQRDPADCFWRSISKDNITTWYGKTAESRIFDQDDHACIFSWLICQSYDDKGNAIVYEYEEENSQEVDRSQAHEQNRNESTRSANRYLKRIKYGNRTPNRDTTSWRATDPTQLSNDTWMFEVVLDYGEGHYAENAPDAQRRIFAQAQTQPAAGSHWPVRQDPFSTYRAGFDVRTYRLCRRVLMFHHFPQELSVPDYLVRSTEFAYSESPIASFIIRVVPSGYVRYPAQNRYLKKSLPSLEFEYSQVPVAQQLARQPIQEVDPESLEGLPIGLDGASYQWMDLDGEGTSGILTEQADGWYYKRNLSANNQVREDGHERTHAHFGPVEVVSRKPAGGLSGGAQFLDLAGDGQVDLVQMEGSVRGFYERTDDASWVQFQPFTSWPNLTTRDPGLKFVDLTGDGHADILITEGEALAWHPSLAEAGFGPAVRVNLPLDEENGPRLIFADSTQSIYLADLSGDGLSDLARIRNGEVCYWPNLGYGRFGAKVTMDNAPWFDTADLFDQRRIRLADTDGSGTTDILYLRRDGAQIYFNQCGNGWSNAVALSQFPPIDNVASVQVLDLLGNGTACLVWSSALPGNARQPMRYLALMDEKPHLLVGMKNNLGAETRVYYAPSTRFYLDDKEAGHPWITRLPFPVHVVERVETYDHISRNRFVSRYTYHHGYFDGEEREFRGFGLVEQLDTEAFATLSAGGDLPTGENVEAASHVPPVLTRTWFHTGAFLEGEKVSLQLAHEYYGAPSVDDPNFDTAFAAFIQTLLPDTILPPDLWAEETPEACRALKGSMLRQEVYALDGTDRQQYPYTVAEQNFTIRALQPREGNRHAVFFTHAREALTYHYERNPADPRIAHALTLEVDAFGNVLRSLAVGYPRENVPERQPEQNETHIMLTLNRFANRDDQADWRRIGLPVESRSYEVAKPPAAAQRFTWQGMRDLITALVPLNQNEPAPANTIPYERWDWRKTWNPQNEPGGLVNGVPANTRLRLVEHVRTLYRNDDLTGLLALGGAGSLALPGESYKLAFTPGLLAQVYRRPLDTIRPPGAPPPEDLLPNPATVLGGQGADRGGYILSQDLKTAGVFPNTDPNGYWWIPAGRIFYSLNGGDTASQELAFARAHFFLPHRFRDPFGSDVTVTYDGDAATPSRNHNLLIVETRDPLDNVVTVKTEADDGSVAIRNDYRVLQAYWVTDPNRNRTRVAFDALGMVAATAAMGKPGESKGDHLANFEADLTQAQLDSFIAAPRQPSANPKESEATPIVHDLLQGATTRIVCDLDRFMRLGEPPFAATIIRETHVRDLQAGQRSKLQISFSYSDGFGREIQKKIQAEPGPVPQRDANGRIVVDANGEPRLSASDMSPRWVGSGWTIFNNKGKPVRQYEPFFTDTHHFEFDVRIGVSPILFYDPVERVVATLHPNHTYEKVIFDPWQQVTFDVNDTVAARGAETGDPRTDPDIQGYVKDYFATQPNAWQTWYAQRQGGAAQEQDAARKAAAHAGTPTTAHFDTLGRTFLTVAHNRFERNGATVDERYSTRIEFDIEGSQRAVVDARGRVVMRYHYDLLGSRLHQASMEAGERWMLNDVTGKPIRAWDSRKFMRRMTYDALRRPLDLFVTENGVERLAESTVYGESQGDGNNHRMRVYQVFDGAGKVTNERYDFKGNLLQGKRELLPGYQQAVNWLQSPTPNDGTFTSSTEYDALNRPTAVTAPDSSIYRPTFNEANLLDRVDVNLRGAGTASPFVTDVDYNAKGQRTLIRYGNGAETVYEYDEETFRLIHLGTTRPAGRNGLASQLFANPAVVQDLRYTYDPAGNITRITDGAIPAIQYNSQQVDPSADYIYDAIYRLISAHGREHVGQTAFDFSPPNNNYRDFPFVGLQPGPNTPAAVRNYTETYDYDEVGNFKSMRHTAANGSWTRTYAYEEDSLIEGAARKSNRLTRTIVGNGVNFPETYAYADAQGNDVHGCMTAINSMTMLWDFEDQLQQVNLGGGGTAYYVYDASGQRARKVIHNQNDKKTKERIYLGGFEIYREFNGLGTAVTLERETLHVMDDKQRIALVETKTEDVSVPAGTLPETLIRYQLGNHLGSATLELDDQTEVITYDEYHPYGTSSLQAARSQTEAAKRYRYTGMERDEESGLSYHTARYYSAWTGRWVAPDPIGLRGGINLFEFASCNPIKHSDRTGTIIELHSVVDYGSPVPDRHTLGHNPQKDHAIAQGKARLMFTDPKGVLHYDPDADPAILEETGKASGGNPAKPHTKKTFHDPQSDVAEIKRLKTEGIKSISGDIVEPSRNVSVRSGYDVKALDTALQGQLDNYFSKDPSPRGWQAEGAKPNPPEQVAKEAAELSKVKAFDPEAARVAPGTKAAIEANAVQAKNLGLDKMKGFSEFSPGFGKPTPVMSVAPVVVQVAITEGWSAARSSGSERAAEIMGKPLAKITGFEMYGMWLNGWQAKRDSSSSTGLKWERSLQGKTEDFLYENWLELMFYLSLGASAVQESLRQETYSGGII